jgi:hypothetical protein
MANQSLTAVIRRYDTLNLSLTNSPYTSSLRSSISFFLGARTLYTHADSRTSTFSDKQNLKSLIARFKPSTQTPLPVLQNWIDQGNKLSSSELRCISRRLIKSKRYNHAFEVRFLFTCLLHSCNLCGSKF